MGGSATIPAAIAAQARVRGGQTALVFENRATTYAELDRSSNQLAQALIASGIRPGDRIAYLGKNSDRYFELLVGVAKARAILVPLNWRLAIAELSFIVQDCQPRMLFVGHDFLTRVEELVGLSSSIESVVVIDGAGVCAEEYVEFRSRGLRDDPQLPIDEEDVVLIMYTSGTTGRPKGAMLTHRSILRVQTSAGLDPDWFTWHPEERALIAMPTFHIGATGQGLRSLRAGSQAIVMREFEPEKVLHNLGRFGVSKLFLVPSAIRILLEQPVIRTLDFRGLRHILYGASPIPLDLLRDAMAVFKCGFVQMYGMTETSGAIAALGPEDHTLEDTPRMQSAGRCLPGVEIEIRANDGRALPAGEIGEIVTRSVANMKGYWDAPELTSQVLDAEGWLRTGDVGYLDADGYLFVHDRLKDMIISGGENIYPAEVENAIFGHPAVADVAVIGVPSRRWGEEVKAIVALRPGFEPQPESIIDWARARIAAYKVPKSVTFVESLPRNASGKLLRRELREKYWKDLARPVN